MNVREAFKKWYPKCLPTDMFIMDEDNQDSKFKLNWKGESTIAPSAPSSDDVRWMHFIVPATCLASKPEFQAAIVGLLEEIGMELKKEENDFKCI